MRYLHIVHKIYHVVTINYRISTTLVARVLNFIQCHDIFLRL